MTKMKLTCIMCPVGCNLTVKKLKNEIIVTGNGCPRGETFGKSEAINPTRIVTSIIPYKDRTVSVKTTNPIPKNKIIECLNEIRNVKLNPPVRMGQVVIKNVCGTGESVVITGIN
ncbi:MAG: DUF1667 domain-containing protein [Clostridia bacterium]|nr:DUF1667 domain-containing protein [Clostridia bacterium]